ncbi:MAG: hypothetical protein V4722_22545 [Bacteroidota bacterium]
MKKLITASLTMVFLSLACKKSKPDHLIFGVWVEKTMRLDTLDFDIQNLIDATEPTVNFLTKPYMDTVLQPVFPVADASLYNYILNGDKTSIQLRSHFRSTLTYDVYPISFSADGRTLNIGRFYRRRALPAIIEFEKIR